MAWSFTSAGKIVFGAGCSRSAGDEFRALGVRRVGIVTDATIAKLAGPIRESLETADIEVVVFDGCRPEPSLADVDRSVEFARLESINGVLALGGGSCIDTAKLTALVLAHGGSARDFVGEWKVPGPVLPLVAVPTTAGTGSEVSQSAVFTDDASANKVSVLSPFLRPRVALVDPALTYGCPPKVTADSGIDALVHAVEAFTAADHGEFSARPGGPSTYQGAGPLTDLYAEKAIRLVGQFLVRAYESPDDAEAREGMALAALCGGLAFSNAGVALVHAMEYPVGAAVHVSHGAGNGLLLPHVMRYNSGVRAERFAQIANWLGVSTTCLTPAGASSAAASAVEALNSRIGIPRRLSELGVTETMLPEFSRKAANVGRLMRVNPRTPTEAEILVIYRGAL